MYDRYHQMFVGTDYYWNHYGDYRNPELVDLVRQLDITTGAAQQAVAEQILTIIGQEMPIILFGGYPNWYQYNTMYWLGFLQQGGHEDSSRGCLRAPNRFCCQVRSVIPQRAHLCRRLA